MQRWKLINDSATLLDTVKNEHPDSGVLAGGGFTSFAHPKLKFNFTLDIELRVKMSSGQDGIMETLGSQKIEANGLPLKTATRPAPSITYADVNYYNYRTKVATRTEFGTMTLVMYDDSDGRAHSLYQSYLNMMVPATTVSENIFTNHPETIPFGELSSIGPMQNEAGIIKKMNLCHHYAHKGATRRTVYTFVNPKIQNFELDDLSMAESDVNTISLTFVYDTFVMSHEVLNADDSDAAPSAKIDASSIGIGQTKTNFKDNYTGVAQEQTEMFFNGSLDVFRGDKLDEANDY